MPWNVQQGNSLEFVVAFLDVNGNITVPPSATLNITYTTISGSSSVVSLPMTNVASGFTATWGTSVAAVGMALMSVVAPTGVAALADPNLRIT